MANYKAISATGKAILGLIRQYCPASELINPNCELYHAASFENPMTEGFSLYLYRVAVNAFLRNLPPRRTADGGRYRPSIPLDLHYLFTAWAADAERQQRLLGWAVRFLEDWTILPANIINGFLGDRDKNTFHAEEAVELILDPLPLTEHFNLWDKLKPKMQTSVTYVARMVLIDSDREWGEAPPVQAREFHVGTRTGL